ncbi:AAC(3) family N-acetyltransferase [Hamadaea sp. NPDC051192]|uniref:aminoglycoside N(3)-acetyltransferase n=1 Tax=Hamadaea sp. NPDC051192 TaxID=3154940 RepID=UPI003418CE0A
MSADHPAPWTISQLRPHLRQLGVEAGQTVLLHSSLRAVGYVCGGATTVVQAFLDVLGGEGTLVVPAQNQDYVDPSRWPHRRISEEYWEIIRAELPGFDPALTPSVGMGVIAERVRTWPGAVRSNHPNTSFAAVGPDAHKLLDHHELTSPLGDASPLAAMESVGALVVLLGVGFDRCTTFHLAEARLPDLPMQSFSAPMATPEGRQRITYDAVKLNAGDFATLGADFEHDTDSVVRGRIGGAPSCLFTMESATAYAAKWFAANRPPAHR